MANKPARVEVCMITTPDGHVEAGGTSRHLGGPADQAHLVSLRAAADLVLVGAGTARAENYGPPSRPGLRIAVVTRTCGLDFSSPLFASGAGLVVTTKDAPRVPVDSIRAGTGEVDLAGIVAQLSGVVHCEGGPRLNGDLFAADLVDAINLTFSPWLGGTAGRSIAEGSFPWRQFALVDTRTEDGFVFARYERVRNA